MPDAPVTAEPAPVSASEYREAQESEYGTYVAAGPIDFLGARAFNPGDAVPVSHVESGAVDTAQVHKITTKAGRVAAGLPEKG